MCRKRINHKQLVGRSISLLLLLVFITLPSSSAIATVLAVTFVPPTLPPKNIHENRRGREVHSKGYVLSQQFIRRPHEILFTRRSIGRVHYKNTHNALHNIMSLCLQKENEVAITTKRDSLSEGTSNKGQGNKNKKTQNQYNLKRQKHQPRHIVMSKKRKVKIMFRQAKEMERCGQWHKASKLLRKILSIDPFDSYSHLALARLESRRERSVSIAKITTTTKTMTSKQQNPQGGNDEHQINAHTITPLSILSQQISYNNNSTTQSKAREAFYNGSKKCPDSIHIWQAWAIHEQSLGEIENARYLFRRALLLDESNSYACHSFGLLEQRLYNLDLAMELWERPLKSKYRWKCTAALVCSLGKLYEMKGRHNDARDLYMRHVIRIQSEREKSEVYLNAAWLEENHFKNLNRAKELLLLALRVSPGNSRAEVAIARLEGRRRINSKAQNLRLSSSVPSIGNLNGNRGNGKMKKKEGGGGKKDILRMKNEVVKQVMKELCLAQEKDGGGSGESSKNASSEVRDGRLFNAWADLELEEGNFMEGRRVLRRGMQLFPFDHSLVQTMGKIETLASNFTGARYWYSKSLSIEPSAPCLVAYCMLEMRSPENGEFRNFTKVAKLFEEALLLDPRHGPAYNAYGNMELKRDNVDKARRIFQNGVRAHCTDKASVYHGLAMLELSLGKLEVARSILVKGLKEDQLHNYGMMDSNKRKRPIYLSHTLGMLELNSNKPAEAMVVFEDGIERYGNSSQLLLGAALCEVKLGKDDSARHLFRQSVDADRKHAQAWQSWGVMETRAGNYNEAKTLFECGLHNDPNHGALWLAYATLESLRGNISAARDLFTAGVVKSPNHVPLYQAWACLEMRGENFIKAKSLITEGLTKDKAQGSGWLIYAKIEEKLGNEGLVELILKRGLECAPYSTELYCALAEFYSQRGKVNAARELLEKGLEVDPSHAPLYHSLAELEARVFNIEGLNRLNKRAAENFNTNALEPPPASMKILSRKLRVNSPSKKKLSTVVDTLTKMVEIEFDLDETVTEMDPDTLIKDMGKEEVFGDMLQGDGPDSMQ